MTRHSGAGYTLVELVVAMLLLGLISVAVESGLHFGAAVWQRSHAQIGTNQRIVTAQTILRNMLAHSIPRMRGAYVVFEGEPTTLAFDTAPPEAFSHGTAHAMLSVARQHAKSELRLTLTSLADAGIKKRAVIADDVGGLRFAYLDTSGGSAAWLSYWRDRTTLPAAVRISADDPSRWPTLVVHLIISQSASCSLDAVSMTCRKT